MEFTVNKADLVRELSLSQGVVEKKTTIPILSNVLVEAAGERVYLTATDLELGIRCSCPAKVKKQGSGTIPAKRLLDYIRLLPDAPVDIKLADNQWVTITCGRSKTRIAGMSRESYPELPEMPESLAKIPVAAFHTMIGRTIFAISNEESRFTLNGALLLLRDSTLTMVATDGHRLALVQNEGLNLGGIAFRALIPKKAMGEILKLGGDAADDAAFDFSGDDNHLFFRLGDRVLTSRKLTGNFPDYDRVLPKEQPFDLPLPRDEFRSSIERVSQFSDERSKAIRVRLANGELKVFSSISETGESEETMPIEYKDAPMEIGFNAHYLLDFLKAAPPGDIRFLFKDGNAAGEYRPADAGAGSQYRYVVMPMRI